MDNLQDTKSIEEFLETTSDIVEEETIKEEIKIKSDLHIKQINVVEKLNNILLYKDKNNGYNFPELYTIADQICRKIGIEEMYRLVMMSFEKEELIQVLLSIAIQKEL